MGTTGESIANPSRGESTARESERLALLYQAGRRLSATLDLDELYSIICEYMSLVAPNEGFYISSFDPDSQLISCRACWLDEQWMDVGELPPIPLEEEGKGTQSLVIRTGRPLLLNDYQAQQRTAANVYCVDAASGTVSPETPEEDDERVRSALIVPLTVGGEVRGAIQVTSCRRDAFTQDQLQLLDALGAHIASAVQNATLYRRVQEELRERERAEEALARSTAQLRRQVHDTVQSMGAIVGMRDPCPAAHERRVTSLALAIAAELGLDEDTCEGLALAGDVHDIGKVGVPAEIVAQHHERLDGSGYPAGRRGDQIMLEARIIAVSDVVGATASHRPYRPRLGLDHALAEVPSGAGTRHDEAVVVAREQVFANGYALVE